MPSCITECSEYMDTKKMAKAAVMMIIRMMNFMSSCTILKMTFTIGPIAGWNSIMRISSRMSRDAVRDRKMADES